MVAANYMLQLKYVSVCRKNVESSDKCVNCEGKNGILTNIIYINKDLD